MQSNDYALITGASNGIGLELAEVFAKNGTPVILSARSEAKLTALAADLTKKYGIAAHAVAADLSKSEEVQRLYDTVKSNGWKVEYLVNNAGFGDFGKFHTTNWEKQAQMIDLNVRSLTQLTHLYLPEMVTRNSGRIMQLASTASFLPGPLMSVYFATKSFVLHFSEAIAEELSNTNVTITALCPGPTTSGFQEAADIMESKMVKGKALPTSKDVAEYGYQVMMQGKIVAVHGLKNKILSQSYRFTPRKMLTKVVRFLQDKV